MIIRKEDYGSLSKNKMEEIWPIRLKYKVNEITHVVKVVSIPSLQGFMILHKAVLERKLKRGYSTNDVNVKMVWKGHWTLKF